MHVTYTYSSTVQPSPARRDGQSSNASGDWSGILESPGKTGQVPFWVFLLWHMWSMHLKSLQVYILCVDICILFAYIKNDESIHFCEGKPTTTVTVCWHDPIYVDGYAYIICIYHISTCASSLRTLCVTCCFG